MNIPLTISCFFILGFIPISNGCCCTWLCSEGLKEFYFKSNIKSLSSIALKIYVFISYILIISISGNCNPFGCDCIYEHCGGWLPWCDPNEMCADKKRNMMEVHKYYMKLSKCLHITEKY